MATNKCIENQYPLIVVDELKETPMQEALVGRPVTFGKSLKCNTAIKNGKGLRASIWTQITIRAPVASSHNTCN